MQPYYALKFLLDGLVICNVTESQIWTALDFWIPKRRSGRGIQEEKKRQSGKGMEGSLLPDTAVIKQKLNEDHLSGISEIRLYLSFPTNPMI